MATISTILILPILIFILFIPVLLGIYVYRDAKSRDMNPALWTFIAVFVPSFMGFIAYLIVRGNYSGLICPNCGTGVERSYSVCPKCGTKLRVSCTKCGMSIENGWNVCPQCATPVTVSPTAVHPPVQRRDRVLGKILAVIVAIPLALLIFILVFSVPAWTEFDGAMNTFMISYDTYMEDKNDPRIAAWYESCGADYDRAYILMYETVRNDKQATHYLIYIPFADENTEFETGRGSSGLFGNSKVELKLSGSGIGDGGYIFGVSTYGDEHTDLVIYYNGKELETEVTPIDFNPMIFEVVGEDLE